MDGLRGGRAKASLSPDAPVADPPPLFAFPSQATPHSSAQTDGRGRNLASAIVTRLGGDVRPARGKKADGSARVSA